MKRIHNWHKMVPTEQQIRASKRWIDIAQKAHDTSELFFRLAADVPSPLMCEGLINIMNRYYKIAHYCQLRSDMSLIVNEK
jgi:hypothetical protein